MESITLLAILIGILLIAGVSKRLRDTISLIGTKLQPVTVLFLGWFGPRGIASILYVLIVLDEDLATEEIIYNVVMITVFLSVLAHGISATPLANWYVNRVAELDDEGSADAETKSVPEMPTRTGNVQVGTVPSSVAYDSN